jgi:hypothetical protein
VYKISPDNKAHWTESFMRKRQCTQQVKKFSAFCIVQRFITCSQESATGPHPEPGGSGPHHHIVSRSSVFHIIFPSTSGSSELSLPLRLLDRNCGRIFHLLLRAKCPVQFILLMVVVVIVFGGKEPAGYGAFEVKSVT